MKISDLTTLTEQIDYCQHCGELILPESYQGGLRKWFKEKWVNIGKKVKGKHPPCGTSGSKKGYAKCVPAKKARSMDKADKESAVRRKRSAQNKAGRGGKDSPGSGKSPIRVTTETIRKVDGGYRLVSKKTGKNLGTYPTRAGAEKREQQVQYFKHTK